MCKALIANSFLEKLGRVTEHLPGVDQVVDLVVEFVIPHSVAGAACQPDINTSASSICYPYVPKNSDSLVYPLWCNDHWDWGYMCYYYKAIYSGGWKNNTYYKNGCSQWSTSLSCPPCWTGHSDACV